MEENNKHWEDKRIDKEKFLLNCETDYHIKHRRGIVHFHHQSIFSEPEKSQLKAIFSVFYPIKIETEFDGTMKYYGYSEFFDKIEEGEQIPEYDFVLIRTKERVFVKEVIRK